MTGLAGVLVGEYFLLECLSREGQVEMYRARPTTKAGYDVLLRLFRPRFPDSTNFCMQFANEVEKVWHCHHEGLLPLHEFGASDELFYCVTLFPEMSTLQHLLARQTQHVLPLEHIMHLIVQLCDAVHYLHTHDIVHGNIQPSSIYLRNGHDAVLTNYSMRRAYQEGEILALLLDEGNAVYVAPEQSLGMVCPASDIYALGVLFYHLLSGFSPYDGVNAEEITWQHIHDPIPSLRALHPELPEAVEPIVWKALAKHPEHRFPNAHALAEALLAALMQDSEQNSPLEADNENSHSVHMRTRRTLFSRTHIRALLTLSQRPMSEWSKIK